MSLPVTYYQWLDDGWSCAQNGHRADMRESRLFHWCCHRLHHPVTHTRITPISGDASFRRYFRIMAGESHHVAMDSPPDKENNAAYVRIADRLAAAGVRVPKIIAIDTERGFLLLSDLGRQHYLEVLTEDNADFLYEKALLSLVTMQAGVDIGDMPIFDRKQLMTEMQLFADWLIEAYLDLPVPPDGLLEQSFDFLADHALRQPRVFVHRDYHSRNLIHAADASPGVLDFQDAVSGPYSYDAVSLLKDCYIRWSPERVYRWAGRYHRLAAEKGLSMPSPDVFRRDFDLMGVQRHLKAAGIFARLFLRDRKPGYLVDIPRTLSYITDIDPATGPLRYRELAPLTRWLRDSVIPDLQKRTGVPCKP